MGESILIKIKETYQKGEEPYTNQKALEGKERILRIITRYNDMMLLTGIYPEYNNAFLKSDESRRAMLTTGCYILEGGKVTLEKPKEDAFYWPGCDMAIPENAKIILSFNNPYPSAFIKQENGEIFIEENSWHLNYIDNDNLLESVTGVDDNNIKAYEAAFPKGKTEKSSDPNFQTIEMTVKEELKNYDIVVQVPYITPSADMLLKVSFKDKKDEIILSTS